MQCHAIKADARPTVTHEGADIGMVGIVRRCQHFAVMFAEKEQRLLFGKPLQLPKREHFARTCVGSGGAGDAILTDAIAEGLRGVGVMRFDSSDHSGEVELGGKLVQQVGNA